MSVRNYSLFRGVLHPPGKKDASEVEFIADDMTQEELDKLDVTGYPVTDDHPPPGASIMKHPELVRGRVLVQYRGKDGSKHVVCQLNHDRLSGCQTKARIESGSTASLSLGHRYRDIEYHDGSYGHQFLPDHIAIVDEPRREGCYLEALMPMRTKIATDDNRRRTDAYLDRVRGEISAREKGEPVIREVYQNASLQSKIATMADAQQVSSAATTSAPATTMDTTSTPAPAATTAAPQAASVPPQESSPAPTQGVDMEKLDPAEKDAILYETAGRLVQEKERAAALESKLKEAEALKEKLAHYEKLENERKEREEAARRKEQEEQLAALREHLLQEAQKDEIVKQKVIEKLPYLDDPKELYSSVYKPEDCKTEAGKMDGAKNWMEVVNCANSRRHDATRRTENAVRENRNKRYREDPGVQSYLSGMSMERETKRARIDMPAPSPSAVQSELLSAFDQSKSIERLGGEAAGRVAGMRRQMGNMAAYYRETMPRLPTAQSKLPKGYRDM